jgi:hypothetical protein
MNRASIFAALAIGLLAPTAWAGDSTEPGDNGQSVPISAVALPIVVKGKLVNYVFVTVRLELAPLANATKLRDKEPYFRDALVRAGHRTPFTLASDLTRVDEVKLKAAMLREAQAIAGPNAVKSVQILNQAPKKIHVIL